jgi:hypothetical protein
MLSVLSLNHQFLIPSLVKWFRCRDRRTPWVRCTGVSHGTMPTLTHTLGNLFYLFIVIHTFDLHRPIPSTSPASVYWGIDQATTYGEFGTPILNLPAGIVDTGE